MGFYYSTTAAVTSEGSKERSNKEEGRKEGREGGRAGTPVLCSPSPVFRLDLVNIFRLPSLPTGCEREARGGWKGWQVGGRGARVGGG